MAIKNKHIKKCERVISSLEDDHNIRLGDVFRVVGTRSNVTRRYISFTGGTVENHTLKNIKMNNSWNIFDENECIMFVNFLYIPKMWGRHGFLFLRKNSLVILPFRKKETIKNLKFWLEKLNKNNV